jgi:hypothetical protein
VTGDVTSDFADFDAYDAGTAETERAEPERAETEPSDAAEVELTGNDQVDAATALLADLQDQPTAEHADVFEDVHRRLQGALADLDGG